MADSQWGSLLSQHTMPPIFGVRKGLEIVCRAGGRHRFLWRGDGFKIRIVTDFNVNRTVAEHRQDGLKPCASSLPQRALGRPGEVELCY